VERYDNWSLLEGLAWIAKQYPDDYQSCSNCHNRPIPRPRPKPAPRLNTARKLQPRSLLGRLFAASRVRPLAATPPSRVPHPANLAQMPGAMSKLLRAGKASG
jgi:hypothetical protein